MSSVTEKETPELSEAELVRITGYVRSHKQMEMLRGLGIPARLRRDNTVLVLRMHMTHPAALQAGNDAPKLKSSRK